MTVAFLLTALVVCVSPGIGVVYTLSMALRGGARAGLLASVGCTLCTVLHLGFALAGLAAILHTTALLFQAIKFAGVLYLLWMAGLDAPPRRSTRSGVPCRDGGRRTNRLARSAAQRAEPQAATLLRRVPTAVRAGGGSARNAVACGTRSRLRRDDLRGSSRPMPCLPARRDARSSNAPVPWTCCAGSSLRPSLPWACGSRSRKRDAFLSM